MDERSLWGIIVLIYAGPFSFWLVYQYIKVDFFQKERTPSPAGKRREQNLTKTSLLWSGGLVLLLSAWQAGWHPIGASIVFTAVAVVALVIRVALRKMTLFTIRAVRIWLAASGVWLFAVLAWYLTFQRDTSLEDHQFLMIGIFPPLIAVAALGAFRWANRAQK